MELSPSCGIRSAKHGIGDREAEPLLLLPAPVNQIGTCELTDSSDELDEGWVWTAVIWRGVQSTAFIRVGLTAPSRWFCPLDAVSDGPCKAPMLLLRSSRP